MDDPAVAIGLWFLTVMALAIAIPIVLAIGLVVLIGLCLRKLLIFGMEVMRNRSVERELGRIASEQHAAIRDIVALRNEGERRMRAIADERASEGWRP
jgi:hypothetical protein